MDEVVNSLERTMKSVKKMSDLKLNLNNSDAYKLFIVASTFNMETEYDDRYPYNFFGIPTKKYFQVASVMVCAYIATFYFEYLMPEFKGEDPLYVKCLELKDELPALKGIFKSELQWKAYLLKIYIRMLFIIINVS